MDSLDRSRDMINPSLHLHETMNLLHDFLPLPLMSKHVWNVAGNAPNCYLLTCLARNCWDFAMIWVKDCVGSLGMPPIPEKRC